MTGAESSTESPAFTPKDPEFEARVRASFGRQGIMTLIGARLTRVEPGLVEIELPYRADLTQQYGFFHAGITSTIADSAGGYAAYSLMPAGTSVLTTEFKINLLAPAEGEFLRARPRDQAGAHLERLRRRCLRGQGRPDHALCQAAGGPDVPGGPPGWTGVTGVEPQRHRGTEEKVKGNHEDTKTRRIHKVGFRARSAQPRFLRVLVPYW